LRDIITNKKYDNQFTAKNETEENYFFFFCGNVRKRNQVRVRDKYNMWKIKKTMKIKNTNYLNNFFSLLYIKCYTYKRNKKYLILFSLIFQYTII